MGTDRQAYQAFRNRLDAVLRQRNPAALREFLVAEGQWQSDTTTNTEAAMWMMIATSPALSALHDEARRWLLANGHEAEASAIFGGREPGGAPGGARRSGPDRSRANRGEPNRREPNRREPNRGGGPMRPGRRRNQPDQPERDARTRRSDPPPPPRQLPGPRPAHAPMFPAATHPDVPPRHPNSARPLRPPMRPPRDTSALRPGAPQRDNSPRERPE